MKSSTKEQKSVPPDWDGGEGTPRLHSCERSKYRSGAVLVPLPWLTLLAFALPGGTWSSGRKMRDRITQSWVGILAQIHTSCEDRKQWSLVCHI